jgi:hypothetical protein
MKREVIDYPAKGGYMKSPYTNVEPGSSRYPWQSTAGLTLGEAWSSTITNTNWPKLPNGYLVHWPGGPATLTPYAEVSWSPAPTLCRFISVTLEVAWDTSQEGPNSWWAPPDNSFLPRLLIYIKGRDGSTRHYSGVSQMPDNDVYNTNTNTEQTPNPIVFSYQWTAHPDGGPFTLADMNDLVSGVELALSNGPNGRVNDDPIRFPKVRVFYMKRTFEIEDLGGHVANVRQSASIALRFFRRARNIIKPVTHMDQAPVGVGSKVYLSHPRGPSFDSTGWGQRVLERRPGLITKRIYKPESFVVEDEVFDLNSYRCLGWAAYRIDAPWNPELQGVALVDKGVGWEHNRAQDSWSPRPGDGVLNRVLDEYPAICPEGLPVAAGDDDSICIRNYDLMQSGWSTVGDSGDFDVSADSSVTHAEEQGYIGSAKLEYGSSGGTGGRSRSLGTLGAGRLHVRVIVKNTSVPDPDTQNAEWYLTDGTNYWNATSRSWIASAQYNDIPSDEPYGEAISDSITISGGTYTIAVGRFSSNLSSVTIHGAIVDVQETDTTVAGARPALATLDDPITRVAETHKMFHTWDRDLWSHIRGTAVCEVRPFWRAEDLPADAVKPLLHAQHVTNTWDALQFVPKTGSDDLVRFERAMDGKGTYQLDCPIDSIDLTRDHVLRAWCRWLGADGWAQFAPYSVSVGYAVFLRSDGSLVGSGETLGVLSDTTSYPYDRTYLGIGCDETRHLDGYVRMWETRRNPISGTEAVWRI